MLLAVQLLNKMRIKLQAIIFLLFASGCSMEKYCDKRFPAKEYTTVDTTIRYECWYDTIYVPEKSIVIDTLVPEIPFDLFFHKTTKRGGLTASVDISKGRINFRCAEDSLMSIIQHQKEIIRISRKELKVKTDQCKLPHKTKFNYFCTYFFWLIASVLVLLIFVKYKK